MPQMFRDSASYSRHKQPPQLLKPKYLCVEVLRRGDGRGGGGGGVGDEGVAHARPVLAPFEACVAVASTLQGRREWESVRLSSGLK